VLNFVNGGREAGIALVGHRDVAKVALIGSIAAGKAVMRSAADTLKSLTLELGGKNAFVACGDADPAIIADAIVRGMNFSSVAGQSCGSTSRIFVHEDIYDTVVAALPASVGRIRVGLPTDPEATMGSLSTAAQFDKTMDYIRIGREEGARLLAGGNALTAGIFANGYFVEPTIFCDVTDDMRLAREEIFGPVVSILKWSDEADVIARVNALEHGLTAAIWTRDIDRGHRMANRIDAGYVWVNDVSTHEIGMPFGGFKQSGIGKEEAFEEMLGYTREKNVHVKFKM
jgi:betaine-aldehyde dehydrogenase